MPEQAQVKIKGPETFIVSLIDYLKEKYIIIPTSKILRNPGEASFIYLTVVEVSQ